MKGSMSLKYQAVIFDLDGTLCYSAPGILQGVRHVLGLMGHEVPDEASLRRFLGPPLMQTFTGICGMSEKEAEEALRLYRDYYYQTGYFDNAVYPGIRALLSALKAQGAFIGIATHKPLVPSLKILQGFGLLRYIDQVEGPGEEETPEKAELIRRAAPKGLKAVMIGDRLTDIEGAHDAGIDSIAALYGYGHQEEFMGAGAVGMARTVGDLYSLLGAKKPEARGYFISFEGNDGSGKSTQARLLAQRLRQCGYDVLLTREPGGTGIGEKIREILLDRANADMEDMTEALLYAAARAQHVRQVILPALAQGKLVISDRFVDSSIAYQGAGRGLGMDLVRQINAFAIDGCLPDLTVFLSLDPMEGMARRSRSGAMDRLEAAADAFHQEVGRAFSEIVRSEKRFLVLPSLPNKQDTAENVFLKVTDRLREDGLP